MTIILALMVLIIILFLTAITILYDLTILSLYHMNHIQGQSDLDVEISLVWRVHHVM